MTAYNAYDRLRALSWSEAEMYIDSDHPIANPTKRKCSACGKALDKRNRTGTCRAHRKSVKLNKNRFLPRPSGYSTTLQTIVRAVDLNCSEEKLITAIKIYLHRHDQPDTYEQIAVNLDLRGKKDVEVGYNKIRDKLKSGDENLARIIQKIRDSYNQI